MGIKLVLLLAIASLAQSSSGLKVCYGHSKNESAVLSQIRDNQKAAVLSSTDGWNLVYITINKLAAKLTYNLHRECNVDTSAFTRAASKVKNTIDKGLDSVSLAAGKSCASVEAIRKTIYLDLDFAFTTLANALKLAHSGNYHKNQATIEAYKVAVRNRWMKSRKNYVNFICTCLNTTDADTIAVIQGLRGTQSKTALLDILDAPFSAIKYYGAAVDTKRADISLLIEIEGFRCKSLSAIQENTENKYSLFLTLSKCSRAYGKSIIRGLAVIDYAEMISSHRFKSGNQVLFETVIRDLKRLALKLKADGKEDSCRTCDNAQARAVIRFKAGDAAFISSMLSLHPKSSAAILAAQEKLFDTENRRGTFYFAAITIAADKSNNYPGTFLVIQRFRRATTSLAPSYTQLIFDLIRNNRSFSKKIEAELKALQNKAVSDRESASNKFFDAVEILAKKTSEGKISEADITAVRALMSVSNSRLDDFFRSVAAACLSVLRASKAG